MTWNFHLTHMTTFGIYYLTIYYLPFAILGFTIWGFTICYLGIYYLPYGQPSFQTKKGRKKSPAPILHHPSARRSVIDYRFKNEQTSL